MPVIQLNTGCLNFFQLIWIFWGISNIIGPIVIISFALNKYVFPEGTLTVNDIPDAAVLSQEMKDTIVLYGIEYFIIYAEAVYCLYGVAQLSILLYIERKYLPYLLHLFIGFIPFSIGIAKIVALSIRYANCTQYWICIIPTATDPGGPASVPFRVMFYSSIYFTIQGIIQVIYLNTAIKMLQSNVLRNRKLLGSADIEIASKETMRLMGSDSDSDSDDSPTAVSIQSLSKPVFRGPIELSDIPARNIS